ncbi:unnamed protein product, partial [Discosporangium mesarthrocarpum]
SNPVWHIHAGAPKAADVPVSFALLLNLVSASNSHDKETLWGFIQRYAPESSAAQNPKLDEMVGYAIAYYEDFVRPAKTYRAATDQERTAFEALSSGLADLAPGTSAEDIQTLVYEVGKTHGFEQLRDWFKALYEVLLGQSQGPRFGGFVALYGVEETRALINDALAGKLG